MSDEELKALLDRWGKRLDAIKDSEMGTWDSGVYQGTVMCINDFKAAMRDAKAIQQREETATT